MRFTQRTYSASADQDKTTNKMDNKMENKFRTPRIDTQNVISFTCSDDSLEPLLELFRKLRSLGQMGCSREVTIDWDGDGRDRLENISVNGMTLDDWEKEWNRLEGIRKVFDNNHSESQNECGENES